MITPADKAGFTIGQTYVLARTDDEYSNWTAGSAVKFVYDDQTDVPKFENCESGDNRFVPLHCFDTVAKVESKPSPLKNFIIDVTDAETTVKVGKILSADQLKRIIEILGE